MELKTIEVLLERYLEGETTLEEETVLRAYFKKEENIPKKWIHYSHFFAYCESAKKESFPSSSKTKSKTPVNIWMMAAASIALVVGLQLGGLFESESTPLKQQEAEFVFQQFQTQMKNVSSHLNKGVQKVAYLDYLDETSQKLLK